MSTPDSLRRHHASASPDEWPYRPTRPSDEPTRDRPPTEPRRDDWDSPYYRELRELRDERAIPYDYEDERFDRDPFADDEPSSGRALRHLASALICLVLTPIGIAAMAYGAERYWRLTLEQVGAERDVRGLVALGAGAGVLVIVAWLGALSPVGPLLSGVVWGLVPTGLYLVYPSETVREVSDLPVFADLALAGAVTWLQHAAFLLVGALLVGAGLGAAMRQPRRTARA